MNLKHLETFYHFCRFMTMSRAADHLNVSQPAVSQQLSLFQAEAGVKLFYREANEYKLTDTGEALFLLSKRIFSRIGQIEDLLEDARKSHTQTLRIGSTKTFARTLMPDLVAAFQEKYPGVRLRLNEGNSAGLLKRVGARQEDVVIVARSKYDSSLRAIPFARCDFVLVARPDHPLTEKEHVSIQSLSGESLIIRERGSGSRNAILGTLRRCGVSPADFMESDSLSFILAYLERRGGVSFLLSYEIKDELERGILKQIALEEVNISFNTDIVTRRGEPMSVATQYFVRLAKKHWICNLQ